MTQGRIPDSAAPAQLLLVSCAGGHLIQLHALHRAWSDYSRLWVVASLRDDDVGSLLEGEEVVFAYGPTSRSLTNLARNTLLAWRLITRARPKAVLTTGAAVAVPFAWVARLRGIRVVYVESLSRSRTPSLSCRLVAPIADRVYVQWPELVRRVRRARYAGTIFSDS